MSREAGAVTRCNRAGGGLGSASLHLLEQLHQRDFGVDGGLRRFCPCAALCCHFVL